MTSDQEPEERRSWFPLALAGGFVVFTLVVAFLAYAANRQGDPSQAVSVDDVAELAIEAVDTADADLGGALQCADDLEPSTWVGADDEAAATKSEVTGGRTGSFRLTVTGREARVLLVTVAEVDGRSCIRTIEGTAE